MDRILKTNNKVTKERRGTCELRPGIGLCDDCGLPKWPQRYMGYGFMVCLDCLEVEAKEKTANQPKRKNEQRIQ